MYSSKFIPELDCERLLLAMREIMDDEDRFAFEKIEDIDKLLQSQRQGAHV